MTHGDKAKAKAAKSSKASVKKAGAPDGENGKSKTVSKAVQASSKAGEAGSEKAAAAQKSSGTPQGSAGTKGKGSSASAKSSAAARNVAAEAGGFNNPVIGAAFKQALKKYPNALRKLTD